jgi:hypothetical protein
MKSLIRALFGTPASPGDARPTEFVTQVLEPTGGTIPRPKGWFYTEQHRGPGSLLWTLSREDIAGGASYTTGVRIQMLMGVAEGTGKTCKQFVLDFVASKQKDAKVIGTRDEQDQGMFTRIGLETEEGPHRILYSLFWGNTMDMVVMSVAGTTKELWDTFSPTFDRMAACELIDPSRFGRAGDPPQHSDATKLNSIRLYLPDEKMKQRIGDVTALMGYLKALQGEAETFWSASDGPCANGILVAVGVKPGGKSRVWCEAVGGEIPAAMLEKFCVALEKVKAIEVKGGPIAFAMELGLRSEMPSEFPVIPQSWTEAAKATGEPLLIPDALFEVIWRD